ncbi:MAG: hypothetical protein ABI741_05355 [Ferruginibacter sp.]
MAIITRLLKNEAFPAWNNFVDEHPCGTIFHKTTWLQLIDPRVKIYAVFNDEEIKAGVALVSTKKNAVSGYHIPPYTQYFSPLYGNADQKKNSLTEEHTCIKAILDEMADAAHVDFKLPKGHQSILPYHWKGYESSVSITHIITGNLADYLRDLNRNKLRELKKLQGLVNAGEIIIEHAIHEADLQHLLKQTEERKSFDGRSALAIDLVMKSTDDIANKFIIRSKEHGLIAFGFFPYDKRAVYNLINASVRVTDPVLKTINLLLLFQAIEFALNSGRTFDFEGSMLPGVEAFCRLMGGVQVPVYRVQKSSSLRYSLLRAAKQIKNDRRKT